MAAWECRAQLRSCLRGWRSGGGGGRVRAGALAALQTPMASVRAAARSETGHGALARELAFGRAHVLEPCACCSSRAHAVAVGAIDESATTAWAQFVPSRNRRSPFVPSRKRRQHERHTHHIRRIRLNALYVCSHPTNPAVCDTSVTRTSPADSAQLAPWPSPRSEKQFYYYGTCVSDI